MAVRVVVFVAVGVWVEVEVGVVFEHLKLHLSNWIDVQYGSWSSI